MPSQPQDRKPKKTTNSQRVQKDYSQPIPSPEPVDSKYAASTWGADGLGSIEDLTVPSGQLCLVQRPGVQGLMTAGVLHKADSLTALVSEKHLKKGARGGDPQVDVESITKDPEALENLLYVVDKVVCYVVMKPEVHMTPGDITRRKKGIIYADMVDLEDKMFIFNYAVGGTRDLETFRNELEGSVGSLESVEDVQDAPVGSLQDQG